MPHWWLFIPASLSLLLALWLFRGRRYSFPHCPKCWYDMSGSPVTCPECGYVATTDHDLHRPRRRPLLAALALLVVLGCSLGAYPRLPRTIYYALAPTWHATQVVTVPGYDIRILEHTDPDDFGRALEIKDSRGQVLFHLDGFYFTIGSQSNPAARSIGIAEDMTGDGVSDLIITTDTGGSGCQQTHYLFQLGNGQPVFAPLAVIEACGYFQDKDGDGIPEFIASDRTFSYRWTSGAGSPHPEVILRWHKAQKRYIVATDLMRRAPNALELAQAEQFLQHALAGPTSAVLTGMVTDEARSLALGTALELIYSGNRDKGLKFLRDNWPDRADVEVFMNDFTKALDESPYAAEVRDLQLLPLPPDSALKKP